MRDGDFSTALPCGGAIDSAPFEDTTERYISEQPYMQAAASFTPTARGTAHPTRTGWFLAAESAPQPLGNGIVKWNRTYVSKPATRYEFQRFAYPFIGYWGMTGINVTQVTGRDRVVIPCQSRIKHEYFRIAATGGDYTSEADIPILAAQKYYYGSPSVLVDFIGNAPPLMMDTTPSRTGYEAWITDANANKWAATIGQIVAEDSTIQPWIGPIFVRSTRYVLAQ
jgi:hypothetical protein